MAAGEPVDNLLVRHLLQQTSGLSDTAGGPVLASARDGTTLEAIAELGNARLHSPPGERWEYANANYARAGLIVERASGMLYRTYVEHRIFAPLGMLRSFTTPGNARLHGVSPGHRLWFGVPVAQPPVMRTGMLAAGYLVSTAEDLGCCSTSRSTGCTGQ